jgi:hypothetical protein
MKQNQRLTAAIIAVVDNQIEANDPPETNQTLTRLLALGYSIKAAKELIGNVVVAEVFEVLNEGKAYDHNRYVDALHKLPEFLD